MKAVNIMNFVRRIDERLPEGSDILYKTTEAELSLVNEFGFENTFLLQYDTVCDGRFVKLFTEQATEKTELGLWYEIVEPLTTSCGLPYRSEMGWKWDWHIIPGFSMAYSQREREMLIDEAMRKFREVFGKYPRTVASWVIDTHTLRYLAENYEIDAIGICRDQTSTDAYTLVGGYFNQAYYPSKNNIFTPAATEEYKINIPVFRLLGPCPVHNYDNRKYMTEAMSASIKAGECFTMEPVWKTGRTPRDIDWFFRTYFENEDMGFSYTQLGQENSFGEIDFIHDLRMQFEKLSGQKGVTVQKMGDTGRWFKEAFPSLTPATSVVATDSWDKDADVESVYYDCKNYMANLFRFEDSVFIRALYLFDERREDLYLKEKCTTFDAIFENLPIVDTLFWSPDKKKGCGLEISGTPCGFSTERVGESGLKVSFGCGSVTFLEDSIIILSGEMRLHLGSHTPDVSVSEDKINYSYKGSEYSLAVEGGVPETCKEYIKIISESGKTVLTPKRN